MALFSYRCPKGHDSDHVFHHTMKPQTVKCPCGKIAKAIINTQMIGSCWPEGRRFEHVGDKTYKNYTEMEKDLAKDGKAIETLSPAQLKTRQEERRHRGGKPLRPKPRKLKTPEIVDKAFRHSPNVETALKALKEGRVT